MSEDECVSEEKLKAAFVLQCRRLVAVANENEVLLRKVEDRVRGYFAQGGGHRSLDRTHEAHGVLVELLEMLEDG